MRKRDPNHKFSLVCHPHKKEWRPGESSTTRITLKFDVNGKLLNPRSAAQNAAVGWGEWQTSKKYPCKFGDAWYVTTAGHGGFILITQEPIPGHEPDNRFAYKFAHIPGDGSKSVTVPCQAFVYEFEEDCAWAVLCHLDQEKLLPAFNAHRNDHLTTDKRRTPLEFYEERILPSLKQWNPTVLGLPERKEDHVQVPQAACPV